MANNVKNDGGSLISRFAAGKLRYFFPANCDIPKILANKSWYLTKNKKILTAFTAIGAIIISLLMIIGLKATPSPEEGENAELWGSLYEYEKYVSTNEDPKFGYVAIQGYPMYLYSFGIMYYELYSHTNDRYYRDKFIRCVDFIAKMRNSDWSWSPYFKDTGFAGDYVSLYNSMFSDIFLKAWKLTDDKQYLADAKDTILGLKGDYNISTDSVPDKFFYNFNFNFYPFCAIAQYFHESRDNNEDLMDMARHAYRYAIGGYDEESGKWYYNDEEKNKSFYDGHSAYYQLVEIRWFLENQEAIKEIFPAEYEEFKKQLPKMISVVSQYILPSGTFYYSQEAPDYTESAGVTLEVYSLYDKMFNDNHKEIIDSAERTIISRQSSSGAYYKSKDGNTVELWYTDGIGEGLARYLQYEKK